MISRNLSLIKIPCSFKNSFLLNSNVKPLGPTLPLSVLNLLKISGERKNATPQAKKVIGNINRKTSRIFNLLVILYYEIDLTCVFFTF